jgi:hypothetical protein
MDVVLGGGRGGYLRTYDCENGTVRKGKKGVS